MGWIVLCDSKLILNLDQIHYIKPWSNPTDMMGERAPLEEPYVAYINTGSLSNQVRVTQNELEQIVEAIGLELEYYGMSTS